MVAAAQNSKTAADKKSEIVQRTSFVNRMAINGISKTITATENRRNNRALLFINLKEESGNVKKAKM